MKSQLSRVGALVVLLVAPLGAAETTFDEAMARATLDYSGRLRTAADELNRTRERIAAEKAPFLQQMRAAEDRIIAADRATTRFETAHATAEEQRRHLLKELDAILKNTRYIGTLAHDSLKAFGDALAPGEEQVLDERLQNLRDRIEAQSGGPAAIDVADFLFERIEHALGGYAAKGDSLIAENNTVLHGTFAFVGPETFFRSEQGDMTGTVRSRAGTHLPITYALPGWERAEAQEFFAGKTADIVADSSGGKALRLKETTGSMLQHIAKGGVVAYAIVVVGLLALGLIVQKIRDVSRMGGDSPAKVQAFLSAVSCSSIIEARQALDSLKSLTHELFSIGLLYRDQPRIILEEHLQAALLRQRLHFERRLPLLAVIATAAPLMGLLGTVVGMVKTFALITVFGTGNAGKLSSGISEVLVATELGLIVAIPTLVAHGFLAHRIQKNLSQLERYALQFVTAVGTAGTRNGTVNGRPAEENPIRA